MKISVVMPVFNTKADYLVESINSVTMQSYPCHELIIVDDGSTRAETIETLKAAKRRSAMGDFPMPVTVISQKNKKISGALNTGIRNMTGDWWAGCASDDLWSPHKLEEQADFIKTCPEAKVLYCDWVYINSIGKITGNFTEPEFKTREEAGRYIINDYFGCWSGMMIHRSVFDTIGLFNEQYPTREDFEMNIRILTRFMMYRVPKTLFAYRIHEEQLTSTNKKEIQEKYRVLARNLAIKYFGEE